MTRAYVIPLAAENTYEYSNRLSYPDDRLFSLSIAWDSRLVSDAGAHYHFYLPAFLFTFGYDVINVVLSKCMWAARNHGDPVSFSFEFVDKEGCDRGY
jgi:hypothetical protein